MSETNPTPLAGAQAEVAELREEVARLREALGE